MEDIPYSEMAMENRCWQYTWLGPVDDKTNKTTACDTSPEYEHIPCFEPIVWTNGTYSHNMPDLSDLWTKCLQGQSVQNTVNHFDFHAYFFN